MAFTNSATEFGTTHSGYKNMPTQNNPLRQRWPKPKPKQPLQSSPMPVHSNDRKRSVRFHIYLDTYILCVLRFVCSAQNRSRRARSTHALFSRFVYKRSRQQITATIARTAPPASRSDCNGRWARWCGIGIAIGESVSESVSESDMKMRADDRNGSANGACGKLCIFGWGAVVRDASSAISISLRWRLARPQNVVVVCCKIYDGIIVMRSRTAAEFPATIAAMSWNRFFCLFVVWFPWLYLVRIDQSPNHKKKERETERRREVRLVLRDGVVIWPRLTLLPHKRKKNAPLICSPNKQQIW